MQFVRKNPEGNTCRVNLQPVFVKALPCCTSIIRSLKTTHGVPRDLILLFICHSWSLTLQHVPVKGGGGGSSGGSFQPCSACYFRTHSQSLWCGYTSHSTRRKIIRASSTKCFFFSPNLPGNGTQVQAENKARPSGDLNMCSFPMCSRKKTKHTLSKSAFCSPAPQDRWWRL